MPCPRYVNLAAAMLAACVASDGSTPESTMSGVDAPVEGPDFAVRYQTKYVDVAPGFAQPVCRGTLDKLDRHMDVVSELLDIDIDADRRTKLYWYNEHAVGTLADNQLSCEWCPAGCACYTGNGVVHTDMGALHHELVHAVVTPAWGRSDIVFSEGVAMGLDRRELLPNGYISVHSVSTDERPTELAGGTSHGGGHFVRWLLERDGPEKLRELFVPRLGPSSTKEDVFSAVEEVYGVPFEDLEAEYFATAATIYPAPGLCVGLVHIPWNGDRWELHTTADCDAPHVFGPFDVDASKRPDAPAPMAVVVTLDIPPTLEGVPLTAWSPSGEGVELAPCLDEPLYGVDPELARSRGLHPSTSTPLHPGRYRLELPVYEPGEVYARVCPHNGARPLLDPTEDPEHCVGD